MFLEEVKLEIKEMNHPLLDNSIKSFRYIIIWLLYAVLHTIAMYGLVHVSYTLLIADGLIHAVLMGIFTLFIWSVNLNSNFEALTFYQRFVNQIALAVIFVALWLSIGYFSMYMFYDESTLKLFIPTLHVKCLIGILLYLLVNQIYKINNQSITSTDDLGIMNNEVSNNTIIDSSIEKELIDRISVKSGSKIHIIPVVEIIYLQADGDYVQIVTQQGKFLKEQTMKFFEESLSASQFVRVHRSYIVHVVMISSIEQYEKQNQILVLKNGHKIKVSPSGYKILRQTLHL